MVQIQRIPRPRRARTPRGFGQFGVELHENTAVNVWDSTAEIRYIVIPQRPAGTEGWDEQALAAIVTRNSMIGTDRKLSITIGERQ